MNGRPHLLDWYLNPDGVQVYADWQGMGQGWLNQSSRCPACGYTWEAVAAVGSIGIECPQCLRCEVNYAWEPDENTLDLRNKS